MATRCGTATSGTASSRATTSRQPVRRRTGFRALGHLARAVRRTAPFRLVARAIAGRVRILAGPEVEGRLPLTARLGGVELGQVTLLTQSDPSRPLHGHWLVALWVRPFARRMGVGRLLCGAVLDESGRRGARAVRLTVRSGNEAAIRLYEGLGFSVVTPDAAIAAELDRLRGIEGAPYVAMEAQVRDRG